MLIANICQRSRIPLNINAVDSMGRTAIEIAVDNENVEIVQMLLRQVKPFHLCLLLNPIFTQQQPDVRIGNALLVWKLGRIHLKTVRRSAQSVRESTNWSRHWSTIRPSQGTCWARDGPSTWTQRRQPLPSIQGWNKLLLSRQCPFAATFPRSSLPHISTNSKSSKCCFARTQALRSRTNITG